MKEQVITPRAGRALAGKGKAGEIAQRPTQRGRGSAASRAKGWRRVVGYLPLAGKITLAVIAGVLLFAGYRAAASGLSFQVRTIDVNGTNRASADEIRNLVRSGVAQTGVLQADLVTITRELKKVAWVRDVVVSRVLPDGLRVRIRERQPRAVVRTGAGKFLWVDEDAVTLGAASPADHVFMRGWDEEGTENARAQNRERVEKFLQMAKGLEANGISRRVSEVNLADLHDVRAQLTGDDAEIEIQLGREDFGRRLKFALEELDRQRQTPIGPYILHINVAQGVEKGNHVSIGISPNAPSIHTARDESGGPDVERAKVVSRGTVRSPAHARKPKEEIANKAEGRNRSQQKKEEARRVREKQEESREERVESRPRRVG